MEPGRGRWGTSGAYRLLAFIWGPDQTNAENSDRINQLWDGVRKIAAHRTQFNPNLGNDWPRIRVEAVPHKRDALKSDLAMTVGDDKQESGELPYIDPQMKVLLDEMRVNMAERPPIGTEDPVETRARFAADVAVWNEDPPELPRVENLVVTRASGDVAVRLYDPVAGADPLPAIIYFHGGGWILGDLDTTDRPLRLLAQMSNVAVISVDYCLAPEHQFPEPLDECVAVARWIHQNGTELGIDIDRLSIGGDSAGANLALAVAIDLRNANELWLRFALLVYGAFALPDDDMESYRLFGNGDLGLDNDAMKRLWALYLGGEDAADPRAAPLNADLVGLPPIHIIAAGLDLLRDDSRLLANKLAEAGVEHHYKEYKGVVHGFMGMTTDLDLAVEATKDAASALSFALIDH